MGISPKKVVEAVEATLGTVANSDVSDSDPLFDKQEVDDGFKSEIDEEEIIITASTLLDPEDHETDIKSVSDKTDAEGGFLRYLGERMRMVPKGKRLHAEIALLNTLREFTPE